MIKSLMLNAAVLQESENGLKNSNWIKACEALSMLQRLVAHNAELVAQNLYASHIS